MSFTPGQVVRIHRPGRALHTHYGRFIEPSQDPLLVWVALNKAKSAVSPPDENKYRQTKDADHKLLPLSQLQVV